MPKEVILAADIGGTNTRIALCSVKGKNVTIHKKFECKSKDIKNLKQLLKDFSHGVKVSSACIAAAGPVNRERTICKPTNLTWRIETKKLPLKTILLNDFEALGYAINILKPKDVKVLRRKTVRPGTIVLLGAGTGLGKAILWYDKKFKAYIPHASEGGHADLVVHSKEEFIFKQMIKSHASWGDVLSGEGIVLLYTFLRKEYRGPPLNDPADIMASSSPAAKQTKKWFVRFYARCARSFALDALARSGVFIGGGIAAKNPEVFNKTFLTEFMNCKTHEELLKSIPIKIIKRVDAPLLGAAFAASLTRI